MRLFSDASRAISDPWLRRAFMLAERGRGTTSPNPIVGCVVVDGDRVVGEGFHERAGGPHAEVVALEAAGATARGATAYVTLEPCNHHGRTPPCTEALIAAGVARVVIGMSDPNPVVTGGGAQTLRAAGIDVEFAEDPDPFCEQNEAWLSVSSRSESARGGQPFVRVKVAVSLDGRPALLRGCRAAITGASGASVTALLRRRADAVLVGAATVIADDPALTVRDSQGDPMERQPLRVVLVRTTLPPGDAHVLMDGTARTLVLAPGALAHAARASLPHEIEVSEYDAEGGVASALRTLGDLGVVDLLVEAGPRLLTALWESSSIDELITVQAGGMAGSRAPSLFEGPPDTSATSPETLSHRMAPLESGTLGDVAVTIWRPALSGDAPSRPDVLGSQPSTAPRR